MGYAIRTENLIKRYKDIRIVGIDNMNDYYDVSLKEYRLAELAELAEKEKGHTERCCERA